MSTAFLFTANFSAEGQSLEGVAISQISSQGTVIAYGYSEQPLTLTGTITTYNGGYQVYFNDSLIATGVAQGYSVVSNFTLPDIPAGDYLFTLKDTTTSVDTQFPFRIFVWYIVKAIVPVAPAQLVEGNNVVLNVTILSGDPNRLYNLELLVVPPAGITTNFTKIIPLTTSSLGGANTLVTFPDVTFSPSNSSSIYSGTYNVYLNVSLSLATDGFTLGFTDATQYHRQATVKVNAPGYQPSQSASVAVTFNDNVIFSRQVSASSQGVVATTWTIPSNVSIGTYTIAITPLTTPSKLIPDLQTFQIMGYPISIKATNLAGEVVPQITIEAIDQSTSATISGTTAADGVVKINLETGNYDVNAYWNQAKVGSTQVSITGTNSYTISCRLTDLRVKVQDKNGVAIPFVALNLTYQYVSRTGQTVTGTASGQTGLSGIYTFNSTLPGVSYFVAASKYNTVFNTGNNTIGVLPAQASSQATVLCPDETLSLTTFDYNSVVLPNVRITLIEQASGIFYSVTTDSNGNAQLPVTFGQYRIEVFTSANVLLNETVLNVLSDWNIPIRCVLYNIPVSVKVVDYFGNGVGSVNVQLIKGATTLSETTRSDGVAAFPNVIGGNMEITASPAGNQNAYVATNIQVDSAATITLSMAKYVVLGGALVEVSLLATLLIIVLAILIFVCIEVFRRGGLKLSRKNKS
jgi:hypothetical protein